MFNFVKITQRFNSLCKHKTLLSVLIFIMVDQQSSNVELT